MGLFSALFGKRSSNPSTGGGQIRDIFTPRWSKPPKRPTTQYSEIFHTSPLLDGIQMIAEDVASTQLNLFDKVDLRAHGNSAKAIDSHPLLDFLENPMPTHQELDGWVLMYITVVYRRLHGECFWILERGFNNLPVEAYPIPANWVLAAPTSDHPFFKVLPLGNTSLRQIDVPPQDVIWFKDPDLQNPFDRGRARTEAIGDEIETDEFAAKYAKNFFYNDGTPKSIVIQKGASQDDVNRLREDWMGKIGGFRNANKTAFTNGEIDIKTVGQSAKEMDYVKSRQWLKSTAIQHLQIPPEMMGILEHSNKATIDSAYYLYTKNVLIKECRKMERTLNRQLVPQFDKALVLRFEEVVPEDEAEMITRATTAFTAGLARLNETRESIGMEAIPGGDNIFVRPNTAVAQDLEGNPLAKEILTPAPPAPLEPEPNPVNPSSTPEGSDEPENDEPEDASDDTDQDADPDDAEDPDQEEPPSKGILDGIDVKAVAEALDDIDKAKAARVTLWKQIDTSATDAEPPFRKAVTKVTKKQQYDFEKAYRTAVRGGSDQAAAIKSATDKALGPDADKDLAESMAGAYQSALTTGSGIAAGVLGVEPQIQMYQPAFTDWIAKNGPNIAGIINDTTRKALSKTLTEGIENGELLSDLAGRIQDVFAKLNSDDEMDATRAHTIARTESMKSVNFGQLATYEAHGVERKEWLATQDDRTREDHADADGQVVDIDADFNVGGEKLGYPGDPDGSPGNVVNCRCALMPVLEQNIGGSQDE